MINKECLQSWTDSQGQKALEQVQDIEMKTKDAREGINSSVFYATKKSKSQVISIPNYNLEQYRP